MCFDIKVSFGSARILHRVESCPLCSNRASAVWTRGSIEFFCVHKSFSAHKIVLRQHGALTNLSTQSQMLSSLQKVGSIVWKKGGHVRCSFLVLNGQGKILFPYICIFFVGSVVFIILSIHLPPELPGRFLKIADLLN
jgi:hypothetical protein